MSPVWLFLSFAVIGLHVQSEEPKILKIDELYIRHVTGFAQNREAVVINISQGFKLELVHYSFAVDRAKILDDGRIKMLYATPLPWQDGFLVIGELSRKVIFLDREGRYIKTEQLTAYEGWDPDLALSVLDVGSAQQVWVTANRLSTGTLVLGELNLEKKIFTVRLEIDRHPKFEQFWAGLADQLFL